MKIQKTRQVKTPNRANTFDAGLDFFIPDDMPWESFTIAKGCHLMVPTGIKAEVPQGTALICMEKSGIAKRGLIIGACVVDSGYQGEIHIHLMNPTKDGVMIKRGEKIAQFILVPLLLPTVEVITDRDLFDNKSSRGEGGFGSTGNGLKPDYKWDHEKTGEDSGKYSGGHSFTEGMDPLPSDLTALDGH